MNANVIAFAGRTANRNAAPRAAATGRTARTAHHDNNIVSIAAWLDRARPRRTPTGVFFTTDVLATTGASA